MIKKTKTKQGRGYSGLAKMLTINPGVTVTVNDGIPEGWTRANIDILRQTDIFNA